jgi:hypothetical protein
MVFTLRSLAKATGWGATCALALLTALAIDGKTSWLEVKVSTIGFAFAFVGTLLHPDPTKDKPLP